MLSSHEIFLAKTKKKFAENLQETAVRFNAKAESDRGPLMSLLTYMPKLGAAICSQLECHSEG